MSIQDWGAIGEIVGATGIIVTLLYLAAQKKYARIAATDTSRQNRVAAIRKIETFILSNPEANAAWSKVTDTSYAPMHDPLMEAYDLIRREADIVAKIASPGMLTFPLMCGSHKDMS